MFCTDWRDRVKGENPNASFGSSLFLSLSSNRRLIGGLTGEIGKLLGTKWKEMGEDEKKVSAFSTGYMRLI